jgi:soluble lytic murein transglycosylase-like protein
LAIIAEESRFNPNAVSPVGAVGLMQVMPQWEKVLGISGSLKDPEVSIKYGLQVLGFYMEMYKDIEMALTAYNRGPGPVDMALMHGKDPKNKYAPEVLKVFERLKKLGLKTDT